MKVVIRLDEIHKAFAKAKRKMQNTEGLMRSIANQLEKTVMKNFEAQGRPQRWKSLSKRYAQWKREHGYSDKILIRTGRLRQSINTRYTKDEAMVYCGVKYGVYHQTGTRHLPKRPFLVLPSEDLQIYRRIIDMYVNNLMK